MAILTTANKTFPAKQADPSETQPWQIALKSAIRDPDELCELLHLPQQIAVAAQKAAQYFNLFVPRAWIGRMEQANPDDPLLRQVLPLARELIDENAHSKRLGPVDDPGDDPGDDPVGDQAAKITPGLLQKYHSRVLLITTGACAIHCRYCFRRHYPYSESPKSIDSWHPALQHIDKHPSIQEVILSGGDPLSLVDETLAKLIAQLQQSGHVTRLRIHTRFGLLIPQRITDRLIEILQSTRLQTIMVVHANHPNEIIEIDGDRSVQLALQKLVQAGIPTLNQSVLLRGVNDTPEVLIKLSEVLIQLGVMPYYLHQLDPVRGASHFEVSIDRGRELIQQMRSRLPGYAVPRYVQEIPGEENKRVLA